jgi:hypothetical protein
LLFGGKKDGCRFFAGMTGGGGRYNNLKEKKCRSRRAVYAATKISGFIRGYSTKAILTI